VVSAGAIPDVTGKTLDEAIATLRTADLTVGARNEEFSDTVDAGKILSLIVPEAGLKPGDVVDVVVSKGPDLVDVPNVVGWTVADAMAKLAELGFSVSTNTPEQYWDTKVKSQSVAPGPARRGSEIVVYNP